MAARKVDQRVVELLTSPVRVVLVGTAADQPWLFRGPEEIRKLSALSSRTFRVRTGNDAGVEPPGESRS